MRRQTLLMTILLFLYWSVRRLFELLVLCDQRAKEVEILVLRHELQVLIHDGAGLVNWRLGAAAGWAPV
jgi:hypothetical protein